MFISAAHCAYSMLWPFGPYGTMFTIIMLSTIPLRNFLTRDEPENRLSLSNLPLEIKNRGYFWHISLYFAMFLYKFIIDHHNEPIKARVGGYTHWVHGLEGNFTLWIQDAFLSDLLTDILSFHYLFMYLFILFFTPMYFILVRDHVMADKAALNYIVIYLLAVPLYLFFNVEVTSSFIPGMDALLYQDSWYLEFITNNDPMDNSIPSLHIGLPISLLLLNRLHCRSLGVKINEWRHREFDLFIIVNVFIYAFSIQYLGIHWALDILPGIVLAVICAAFCHTIQPLIRARPENGWSSLLPDRRQTIAAIGVALVCSSWLMLGVVDGAGVDEDQANFRFGEGDVIIDVIEVHSLNSPVTMIVKNVGEYPVEVMLVDLKSAEGHMTRGKIDWNSISNYEQKTQIPIDESIDFSVIPNSIFDTHLIIARISDESVSEGGIGELRITPHYVDDELIYSALLASMPAFFITGIVIDGITRPRTTSATQ